MFPNWEPLSRVVSALVNRLAAIATAPETVQAIELEKLVAELEPDLRDAHIPPPLRERERAGTPEALQSWAVDFMRRLASGSGWEELREN